MAWAVEHLSGTVRELHERSAALLAGTGEMGRVARVLQPVDQAVVLGSTQGLISVDQDACAAAGVDIVRRRSGGGAVLAVPHPCQNGRGTAVTSRYSRGAHLAPDLGSGRWGSSPRRTPKQ